MVTALLARIGSQFCAVVCMWQLWSSHPLRAILLGLPYAARQLLSISISGELLWLGGRCLAESQVGLLASACC